MKPSLAFAWLALALVATDIHAEVPEPFPRPKPASPTEPRAEKLSFAAAARFLDDAAVSWTQNRRCATCHTNVAYLMARPVLTEAPSEGEAIVRRFFEDRVAHWDDPAKGSRPRNSSEVVAVAAALSVNDAQHGARLHPLTRKALDRMWTRQRPDGAWEWEKCSWPPLEHDDYFGAALATLAVAFAPDHYAQAPAARAGLTRLQDYLHKTPAPSLHHRAWVLWASTRLDGVLSADDRRQTIRDLLARQQADGSWSLPSLGDWQGFDGRPNNTKAPGDGYGTGLAVYVLRQAGLSADHEALKKGISWLQGNQRRSGRWFTQSLNTDRAHYISNTGTAFAVLALKACTSAQGQSR